VLASAVTEKNADEFIERLKKNGYKEAKKYKKGSMLRVIYSGFASEGEARTQLKKLRSYEAFEQAWIYEMK
jgi:septal ring-binding cell division protein DamX